MKAIDLDEILSNYLRMMKEDTGIEYVAAVTADDAKAAMLEACKQCLMLAAEKGKANTEFYGWGKECQLDASEYSSVVDKDSIINVEKLIKV